MKGRTGVAINVNVKSWWRGALFLFTRAFFKYTVTIGFVMPGRNDCPPQKLAYTLPGPRICYPEKLSPKVSVVEHFREDKAVGRNVLYIYIKKIFDHYFSIISVLFRLCL